MNLARGVCKFSITNGVFGWKSTRVSINCHIKFISKKCSPFFFVYIYIYIYMRIFLGVLFFKNAKIVKFYNRLKNTHRSTSTLQEFTIIPNVKNYHSKAKY